MLRFLINALSAISLLLCLIVLMSWVRSGFVADVVEFGVVDEFPQTALGYTVGVGTHAGIVGATYSKDWIIEPAGSIPMSEWWFHHETRPLRRTGLRRWFRVVFDFWSGNGQRQDHMYPVGNCVIGHSRADVAVPHWCLTLVLAAPPALRWVVPWVQRRSRRRKGQCLRCGYDLRGGGGRCPECGAAGAAAPARATTSMAGIPSGDRPAKT